MTNLKTSFAGLQLRNPIIVSSSGLTNSVEKNRKLFEAGAGAIVLKSLFEEQIMMEVDTMQDSVYYPEGSDYLRESLKNHKLLEYLTLIEESKKVCSIPIIASINCFNDAEWVHFAQEIERAGADAIEINILALAATTEYEYGDFEQRHIDILRSVKKHVTIPVIMKLGFRFTNPVTLINQLYANGAAAVVLFNRFYQPDIDIEKMEHTTNNVFSHPQELSKSLRWIGISSSVVDKLDYAASGGVHSADDMIKAILSGASAVEICSTIYMNTNEYIAVMIRFLGLWMVRKNFESIAQFKGRLKVKNVKGVNTFERTQFLKYFNDYAIKPEYKE